MDGLTPGQSHGQGGATQQCPGERNPGGMWEAKSAGHEQFCSNWISLKQGKGGTFSVFFFNIIEVVKRKKKNAFGILYHIQVDESR